MLQWTTPSIVVGINHIFYINLYSFISWTGCTKSGLTWSYRILELSMEYTSHLEFGKKTITLILGDFVTNQSCQTNNELDGAAGQSLAAAAAAARWRAFSALASATRCFFCAFSSTLRCFFSAAALGMSHSGSSWPVEFGFPKFLPTCSFQNHEIGSGPQDLPFQISPMITVCKYLHQVVTQAYGNLWKLHIYI